MSDQDKIEPGDQATTENTLTDGDNATVETPDPDPKVSRRRALLAGLAAAPVVLTLMSRSAFANPTNCSVVRSIAAGTSLHTATKIMDGDLQRCPL